MRPVYYYTNSDSHRCRYWKLSPRLSGTVKNMVSKDNEIKTLIFCGHVTSSVTRRGRLPMGSPL